MRSFAAYIAKRKAEDLVISVFVGIGRLMDKLAPVKRNEAPCDIVFFFPFYHTGGAEKVHAQIAGAVCGGGRKNGIIYFTRKSADRTFLPAFISSGARITDISGRTDGKAFYFLNLVMRGAVSSRINRLAGSNPGLVVFNGQSNFGYKCSPWISARVRQIDLSHSFNTFSWIRLPFIPFYRETVMISEVRIQDHLRQYEKLEVPKSYAERLRFIPNGVHIPPDAMPRTFDKPILDVLYAGRATAEKRVDLVARIAFECHNRGLPVRFLFAGDVEAGIPAEFRSCCLLLGPKEATSMEAVYRQADLFILVSETEGMPLSLMEAMAEGCVPMATPVGDIPFHINSDNGLVFSGVQDIDAIVGEAIAFLQRVAEDRVSASRMSASAIQHARTNFDERNSASAYRQLTDA